MQKKFFASRDRKVGDVNLYSGIRHIFTKVSLLFVVITCANLHRIVRRPSDSVISSHQESLIGR